MEKFGNETVLRWKWERGFCLYSWIPRIRTENTQMCHPFSIDRGRPIITSALRPDQPKRPNNNKVVEKDLLPSKLYIPKGQIHLIDNALLQIDNLGFGCIYFQWLACQDFYPIILIYGLNFTTILLLWCFGTCHSDVLFHLFRCISIYIYLFIHVYSGFRPAPDCPVPGKKKKKEMGEGFSRTSIHFHP